MTVIATLRGRVLQNLGDPDGIRYTVPIVTNAFDDAMQDFATKIGFTQTDVILKNDNTQISPTAFFTMPTDIVKLSVVEINGKELRRTSLQEMVGKGNWPTIIGAPNSYFYGEGIGPFLVRLYPDPGPVGTLYSTLPASFCTVTAGFTSQTAQQTLTTSAPASTLTNGSIFSISDGTHTMHATLNSQTATSITFTQLSPIPLTDSANGTIFAAAAVVGSGFISTTAQQTLGVGTIAAGLTNGNIIVISDGTATMHATLNSQTATSITFTQLSPVPRADSINGTVFKVGATIKDGTSANALNVVARYVRNPKSVTSTNTPEIPDAYATALVNFATSACLMLYGTGRDKDAAASYMTEYDDDIRDATRNEYRPPLETRIYGF